MLVVGADGFRYVVEFFELLFDEDLIERPELDPPPDGHGNGQSRDGDDHQAGTNGHIETLEKGLLLMPLFLHRKFTRSFANALSPCAGLGREEKKRAGRDFTPARKKGESSAPASFLTRRGHRGTTGFAFMVVLGMVFLTVVLVTFVATFRVSLVT